MLLAISTLSPDFTAALLLFAFIFLVVAAILALPFRTPLFWLATGLAVWMFVQAWNALAVT